MSQVKKIERGTVIKFLTKGLTPKIIKERLDDKYRPKLNFLFCSEKMGKTFQHGSGWLIKVIIEN